MKVTRKVDAAIGVLNAICGDHLHARANPLATTMAPYVGGEPVATTPAALAAAFPRATARVAVLVHGLGCTEGAWAFPREPGRSYAATLAGLGYTPVHVRYNTGLALSQNGASLAQLLGELVAAWPCAVRELALVGHSMGGLVIRRALEAGGARWLPLVRHAFYLGSPHLGAPWEQLGYGVTRVLRAIGLVHTDLVADVADVRSAGIRDLRRGALRDLDANWIAHHFAAGALGGSERHLATLLLGDAVVRVASASGSASPAPGSEVRVFPGVGHMALAHHPVVDAWIRGCVAGAEEAR
jgi:pimeloyl-ACP methyl ester carboxylesterase